MARKKQPLTPLVTATAIGSKKLAQKEGPREEVREEDYFSVYANDVRIQTSIWDVRIKVGEVDGDSIDHLRIKSFGEIRVTPQLAKRLVLLLAQQLKGYEEKYGHIPTPNE